MLGRNKRKNEIYDLPGFEAIPAVMVEDQTNKFGKRIGMLAIGLLIIFFAASGYIQSAANSKELEQARQDRTALSRSIEQALAQTTEDRDIILTFGAIIAEQNRRLEEAGLDPVEIGPFRDLPEQIENAEPDSNISSNEANPPASLPGAPPSSPTRNVPPAPAPAPSKSSNPQSAPAQQSQPEPEPEQEPEPDSGPLETVTDATCELTGICLN